MEAVLAVAKQNRAVALELIAALTGKSGTASMDHIRKMIKNKALLDAVLQLGLSGVDSSEVAAQSTALVDHVTWLIEKFEAIPLKAAMQPSGTTPEVSGGDQQRLWCLDQLMAVVKNTAIPKTDELFESMLAFFAKHAFFNAATMMRVCSEAKRKFWVATTEFCTTKYGRGAEKGAAVSARSQLVTVVRVITRLHKQYASVTSTAAADRTLFVPWSSDVQRVLAAVKKLWKSTDEKTDSIVELLTLLLLQTMITSSEEESVGHIAAMDDLLACRAKLAGTDKVEDTAEPLPNSVLCDLLVLLTDCMTAASADSSTALSVKLTRKLVDTVFKQHCIDMDGEGVSVLCRVLDPTIVPNEDETMDDSDSDADCDAAKQDDASSLSSGDSSSDDSDDDDADDAEPDAIFMAKLKHAMGSAAAITDANDSADDEPEDLTDEQMISMGFDDKLAEIFRNKKLEKKQKQDILKSCINFKYRILDMVELYASQGANQQPLHFDRHVIRLVLTLFRSLLLHDNPMFFVRDMKKVAAAVGDDGEKKTVRANPSAMLHLQNACELSAQQRKNLTDRMASVIRSTIQKARVRPELESRDYVLGAIAVVFRLISGVDSKTLTMQGTTDGILAIYNSAAPHPSKETQALLCDVFAWLLRGGSISFARDSVFVATTRPLCAHLLDIHLCKRNRHLTSQHLAVIFQRLCDTTIGVADDSESGAVEHALVTGTSVAWSLLASEVFSRFATSSSDIDPVDTAFWDFRRSQLWALVELFLKQARLGENEAVWYREQFAPFLTCAIDAALHGVLGSDMPSAKASAHAKKVLAPVAAFIRRLSKSDIDHGNEGDEQQVYITAVPALASGAVELEPSIISTLLSLQLLPDTTLELIQRVGEKMSQSNAVTTHCTQLVALCHSK